MNYPLISEYIEAIKAAEENFEQLKNLRPILDEEGNPVMSGGNFAVVFKMKDEQTGKLHAVKCFLREQEGRAEAYRMIAEELEFVNSTFLTPIKYLDKELFVDTDQSDETEFPVLMMDWVEGETLDKYIRKHLDDQYELSLLAYQFSRLAMWLMPQPFAHGDLKPDNILVKNDGSLVLVDYDGMYVPAMKWKKARELGSPDFRHPARNEDNYDERIDDFPVASILLSLKSISLQPSLLEEYGAQDRLLLSENDYRNIGQCKILKLLFPSDNEELNIIYSLFLLAYSKVNIADNCLGSLTILGKNLFRRAQVICHGSRYDGFAKELFPKSELPIEPNKKKAYRLFKDLAIRGSEDAQCCLGCILLEKETAKDWIDALYWYREAAKCGNSRALYQLTTKADKFYNGDEVEQNFKKAFSLYQVAADCGSEYAMMMTAFCFENGYGTSADIELAHKISEKIKDSKYICQLGHKYFDGKEVDRNYEKALFWYHKAANSGDESAIMMLGLCYENGLGTPVNNTYAQTWYNKIQKGETALSIGMKYYEGEVEVNYGKAITWFKKAIDMGEDSAYPYLAICYKEGLGVDSPNEKISQELFNKASSAGFYRLIKFNFAQSNYSLCCYLLTIWLSKIKKENADDIENSSLYWFAQDFKEDLEEKGYNLYLSSLEDGIIVNNTRGNLSNPSDIDFSFLLDYERPEYRGRKYGIVRDRWGNYLIGRYEIERKQLNFWGVKCRKCAIFSYSYGQRFEQMVQTDYPFEISKEIYDNIFSILINCIIEIVEILDAQPRKPRQQIINSKFYIRSDKEIFLCNISHKSGFSCYDGVYLSWKDFPDIIFKKSIYGVEEYEKQYGSTFLESEVYENISQIIKDAQMTVESKIKDAYNKYKVQGL